VRFLRALVVEDDEISAKILYYMVLEKMACDMALDGVEGWEKYIEAYDNNKPYTLIFLDIMMPRRDGHVLLEQIRKFEESKKDIKRSNIIITTALTDFEEIEKAFKERCDNYLTKPLSRHRIKQLVEQYSV